MLKLNILFGKYYMFMPLLSLLLSHRKLDLISILTKIIPWQ